LGIAQEFVEQGASVVVTRRLQATLDEAIAVLARHRSRCLPKRDPRPKGIVTDVSKLAEMEAMSRQ